MSTESNNQTIIERLFGAGAHFGFTKSRRHPTVANYIYGSKHGTDIIDLNQSAALLDEAKSVLATAGMNGQTVLFVGTKEEVSDIVRKRAEALNMPYVTNRWIGGMMTNFPEIKKRIDRLTHLLTEQETGELERKYVKRERVTIGREIEKLTTNFGGLKGMDKRPDLLVVVDPRHESIAVQEANDLSIPVVAIMSSDCDASKVQYPVVVNDSLQSSVALTLDELAGALEEGKQQFTPAPAANTTSQPRSSTRQPARTA